MFLRGILAFCLICLCVPLLATEPADSHNQEVVVFVETFLDVRTGKLHSDVVIEIENGRVTSITSGSKDSLDGDFVDLSGFTVLPGLIDAHTHLCDSSYMGADFDHWVFPAATIVAADLLGESNNLGEIAVGKSADLIAVQGNPLEDVRVLEDVHVVMKEGVVVSNRTE